MSELTENKTSDAVRIARMVVPAVVVLVLAFLFKSELSGSMQRGCFELKLETAGIDLKDQSLCTSKDVSNLAGTLTEAGAQEAEEEADSAFQAFEKILVSLSSTKDTLLKEKIALQRLNKKVQESLFSLARKWEREIPNLPSEAKRSRKKVLEEFTKTFDIPTYREPQVLANIVLALPSDSVKSAATMATDIKATYHKNTNSRVRKLKKGIVVK
jgi:hypothetical protein